MLLEIFAIVLVLLVVLTIWLISGFRRWKRNLLSDLHMGSSIANTSVGPIEYALQGEGPVLLPIHGAPGGYDQSLFVMEKWPGKGFSILACSRPGYLQTPLTNRSYSARRKSFQELPSLMRYPRSLKLKSTLEVTYLSYEFACR